MTNDELQWFRQVYVSIFSKFNVTVGRHTMMRNSCITVPAEGKKLLIDENSWSGIFRRCLTGKLFSDIVMKDLVNVRVNQKKWNCSAAPLDNCRGGGSCVQRLTTKLLLNQANVNRVFQYPKLSESKVLVCKVIVWMCCNLTTTQKCLLKCSIRQ